jgi:hypothetical protein
MAVGGTADLFGQKEMKQSIPETDETGKPEHDHFRPSFAGN